WSSAAAVDWSIRGNWRDAKVPVSGDVLVFPASATRLVTTNDVPGLVAGGVEVGQSGYSLDGAGLTLASGSVSTISGDLTVASLSGAGSITFNTLFNNQAVNTTFAG